jgi:hypothetical protein
VEIKENIKIKGGKDELIKVKGKVLVAVTEWSLRPELSWLAWMPGIVGSNPTRGMDVYMYVYVYSMFVFVLRR